MKNNHTYRTLKSSSNCLYKEKGSKFYGYGFSVNSEEEVKEKLAEIREKHSDARHHCYAYRLGIGSEERYRTNDDGEPTNSAGKPIYGQLLSAEVTNVLVVVVRYFGGTKLGVGGLISAYKITARDTLQVGEIIEKQELNYYNISFEYSQMSSVMSFLKGNKIEVISQEFENSCNIVFRVKIIYSATIISQLKEIGGVEVKFLCKK